MKKVDITPEAFDDLEGLKERLDESFGVKKEKEILKAIFTDMKRLARYPQTDIKLFERLFKYKVWVCIGYIRFATLFFYLYAGKITGTNAKT